MSATRGFVLGILLLSSDAFAGAAFDLGPMDPWPLASGELHVCFKSSSKDFDVLRTEALKVLNGTWGRVPGLEFSESCQSSDPSQMTLTISDEEGSGNCGAGKGAACKIGGSKADLASFRRVLVHEVGHGLGLYHEHQSPAAQLCQSEIKIHDGCQQCADGKCSPQEFVDCFFGPLPSAEVTLPATGDFSAADAKKRQLEREPDPTALVLTVYDPLSMMNYCRVEFGAPEDDYSPTEYDLLAVEMLYSTDRTHGLACGAGCMLTSKALVVSSSGMVVPEWIGRGAQGVPMRVPGTSVDVYSVDASQLPSGISTLTYTFRDPWGNARHGSGEVERSDPAFAALVSILAAR